MTDAAVTMRRIANAVRQGRTTRDVGGRLACVIADCPTCGAGRPRPCIALDGTGDRVGTIHAARRDAAADALDQAP